MEANSHASNHSGLFGNKRFFPFVISYIVAGWGIIQFIDWLVGRYAYSPVWTDICVFFLLLLLPGVLIFAWAQSSKRNTSLLEKLILPANALLALAFLVLKYNGAELGATLQKVTVTNEEGQAEERYIATAAHSKRIVFMPFQTGSGIEAEEQWLGMGLPTLQDLDIEQDLRVQSYSPFSLDYYFQGYNYKVTDEVPLSVQRKVAEDLLSDFFVTAEIDKEGDQYQIQYKGYSTQDGEAFFTKSYEGTDYYNFLDDFSKDFSGQVFLDEINNKKHKFIDLPASDLLSPKPEAFKAYTLGLIARSFENNTQKCLQHFKEATDVDPNFTYAYLNSAQVKYGLGQSESGKPDLDKAMELVDVLPERQQFEVKSVYYLFSQDLQKSFRLLEMWRTLYPNNYQPYNRLFELYEKTAAWEKAKQTGTDAIANGHRGPMLLNMARLSANLEEFDEAFRYFEMFKEAYPNKVSEATEIGDIYLKQGQFDKATEFFEEMTLLKPNDYQGYLKLGEIARNSGKFKAAERNFKEALRHAKRFQDTISIWRNQEVLLDAQGKMAECQIAMNNRWQQMSKIYPPVMAASEIFYPQTIYRYTSLGQDKTILRLIDEKIGFFDQQKTDIKCTIMLNYFMVKEDPQEIRRSMNQCGEDIAINSGEVIIPFIEGYYERFMENFEKSNEYFNQFLEASGVVNPEITAMLLDNDRQLGQLDKAQKGFEELLTKSPYHHYVLEKAALLYRDLGNSQKASELLQRLLDMWAESDPDFQPRQKIEQLMEEIGSGS